MKPTTRLTLTLAPLALSSVALAQEAGNRASESTIEQVVITAQRRAENIQDVPVAVSAFSEAELERRQVTRTLDLIQFVPNMIGHNNTGLGTANTYSIRALNNTESIATFDPPVGTYVDDVFMARQNANNFSFFDVERIEVLRGPQGTLFGRNTTGGAINVVMKKPAKEFHAFAEAGFGEYSRTQVRGSVDVPFSDKILTKFSAFYAGDDGYLKNLTTGDTMNGENSWGARAALRALVSDKVTWDVSADYMDSQLSNLVHFIRAGDDTRVNYSRLSSKVGLGPTLVSSRLTNIPLGNEAKASSVISNFTFDVNDSTSLNVITGFRYLHQQFMTDSFDSTTSAVFAPNADYQLVSRANGTATPLVNDGKHTQITQEFKLTSEAFGGTFRYVAGIFGFYDDNDTSFANISIPLVGNAVLTQDRTMKNNTRSGAVYFQGDYKATDALTLTAGVRYTDEKKTIDFAPNVSPLTTRLAGTLPFTTADLLRLGVPDELKVSLVTPRFAAEYKINPDLMLFASATRGFKSGGWNARANVAQLALPFSPEKVWSYEAGMRSEWLDRTLRVNLNAFLMDVKDFQLPAGYADPLTNVINYLTRNFADLRNSGLEAEVTWAPTQNWNVFWGAGMQDAKYRNVDPSITALSANCKARLAAGQSITNICNVSIVTPTGDIAEPVRAPKFTSTLGVNTTIPLGTNWKLVPSVNWAYSAKSWAATANTPIGLQKSHSTFNGGITLRGIDDKLTIAAECTNCTDEEYVTSYLVYPYFNEPRRWMVRARYDF